MHCSTPALKKQAFECLGNEYDSIVCRNVCAGKTVTVMKRENMSVCNRESACSSVFFDVKVYGLCCVQTCKVQNSPVSNKLQSRNGISLHSSDSASPGGWINVCMCTHSHKQFLFSPSSPLNHTLVINHTRNNLAKQTRSQWIHRTEEIPPSMFSPTLWWKRSQS